jgi:hypothetical protein
MGVLLSRYESVLHTLIFCDLRICNFVDLRFADPSFYADLKFPQVRQYMLFLLAPMAYNALIQICTKKDHL